MADQHFFLGDAWLGKRKVPDYCDLGMGARPTNSYALFCPHCAAIWGKIMHDHRQAYCQPVTSSCHLHATFPSDATFTSAYGMAQPDDPRGWTDDLPFAVAKHDVLALCQYYLAHPEKIHLIPRSYE